MSSEFSASEIAAGCPAILLAQQHDMEANATYA